MSELFAEGDSPVSLTPSQRRLLESWSRLDEELQEAVLNLIEKM